MNRRILAGGAAALVVALLAAVLIVRQIVIGGVPTIHRSAGQATTTACATVAMRPGEWAYAITTQQSSASYTAHFLAQGQPVPGTVTGVTGDVNGQFSVTATPTSDPTSQLNPAIGTLMIVVDLRTLDSGSAERDDHVRNDTFEASKYPFATFVAHDSPILTGSYTQGQTVRFKLAGDLTLHGVTRPATFDVQGNLLDDLVTGSGTTVIHIEDYQMKQPEITSVVTVTIDKDIGLMISFVAHRETCARILPSVSPAQ
jgi:polyisoprenoid-binding protein YceI